MGGLQEIGAGQPKVALASEPSREDAFTFSPSHARRGGKPIARRPKLRPKMTMNVRHRRPAPGYLQPGRPCLRATEAASPPLDH